MTANNIDPSIIAKVRANSEPVIVDTTEGWRIGVRGHDLISLGSCLGRLTITEEGEVFHSMIGSRPTFNREEAYSEVSDLEMRAHEIQREIDRL